MSTKKTPENRQGLKADDQICDSVISAPTSEMISSEKPNPGKTSKKMFHSRKASVSDNTFDSETNQIYNQLEIDDPMSSKQKKLADELMKSYTDETQIELIREILHTCKGLNTIKQADCEPKPVPELKNLKALSKIDEKDKRTPKMSELIKLFEPMAIPSKPKRKPLTISRENVGRLCKIYGGVKPK
jgi:hypothetical protein